MQDFDPQKDEDRAYLAAGLTACALGLKTEAILSRQRRSPAEARGRQIAMYLLRTALGISLSRVALAFNRDRNTVAYGCNLIEDCRDDPDFDVWIEQLAVGLSSVVVLDGAAMAVQAMAMRRVLTEYRLRTVLTHGGMVAPVRQTYLAYRGPYTRRQVAGWVSPYIVARLKADACLRAQVAFPDRLAARPTLMLELDQCATSRPSNWLNVCADCRYGLMVELVADTHAPEVIRQNAAAGRYRDEFIRASQPAFARSRPVFDKSTHRRASDRLAKPEQEVGAQAMRQLEELLIDRATVTALTARWRMKAEDVKQVVRDALARLAVAYELSPAVDSPA
jgi:DnaA-like protein